MENVRKRVDIRLVTNEKKLDKLTSKPTYLSSKIFNENLMAVHNVKETLTLNRPAYVGMCILDLSKTLMYDFHYNYIKRSITIEPDSCSPIRAAYNTKTSRSGVGNMWILKNSTSLLSSLDQLDVRTAKSVQTFDFSMLYTSIPHDLLKSRISNLVHNAFRKKDGSVRYTHIKLTRAKGYFTHDINGGGDNMFTADGICEMIEF